MVIIQHYYDFKSLMVILSYTGITFYSVLSFKFHITFTMIFNIVFYSFDFELLLLTELPRRKQ